MRLRSRASVGSACVLALTLGALSGCQTNASAPQASQSPAAAAAPLASLVPERVREAGVLNVGIDPRYPPMEYLNRGEAVGADLDLMEEVGRRLGLTVRFTEDAYALLVPGVAAGRFDAAISALGVDANDLQNANMVTYFRAGSQLAVRPPVKKRFGPNNLCGRKVTVLDGSTQYSQLMERSANCVEAQRKAISILTYQAQEAATQAVLDEQAYGTLAESPLVQRAVAMSNGALEANGRKFDIVPYGIAVAQQRKPLAEAIRAALQEMIDDGTYQQILDEWDIGEGAIETARVLTRRDTPEPTPLSTETFAPVSPSASASPSPTL